MTILRSNSSKASCASHIKQYLEGPEGERILAERVLGFDMPSLICCWDKVMDDTRNLEGAGDFHNGKAVTTYRHFVLSPDPESGITRNTLLEMASDWARMHFGDVDARGKLGRFESYICIHDDGGGNVPHAHVIVNNCDLDTRKRLRMSPKEFSGLWDSLQDVSRDWGLPALPSHEEWRKTSAARAKATADAKEHELYWRIGPEAEKALSSKRRALWKAKAVYRAYLRDGRGDTAKARELKAEIARMTEDLGRAQRKFARKGKGRRLSKVERSLMRSGGFSWKQEIADAVKLSVDTSRSEDEFIDTLGELGYSCEEAGGDYLFHHPSNPRQWKVSGAKLGYNYRRDDLLARIDPRRAVPGYVRGQALADILSLMADEARVEAYVGKAERLSAASKAVRYLRDNGIRSQEGFAEIAARIDERERRGESPEKVSRLRSRLRFAEEVCSRGDYFLNAPEDAPGIMPRHRKRNDEYDDGSVGNRRGGEPQGSGSSAGGRTNAQSRASDKERRLQR